MRHAPWLLSLLSLLAYVPQVLLARRANRLYPPAPTGARLLLAQAFVLAMLAGAPHLFPEVAIAIFGALLLMSAEAATQLWYAKYLGTEYLRDQQRELVRATGLARSFTFLAGLRCFPTVLGVLLIFATQLGVPTRWLGFGLCVYGVLTPFAALPHYRRWTQPDTPEARGEVAAPQG